MNYTTVHHYLKVDLGVSDAQYIVADLIYQLCTNPAAPVSGWCTMKRLKMSQKLGYSERKVSRQITALRSMDLVHTSEDGKRKQTTSKYNQIRHNFIAMPTKYVTGQSVSQGGTMCPAGRDDVSLMYENNIKNDNITLTPTEQTRLMDQVESRFADANLYELDLARRKFMIKNDQAPEGQRILSDSTAYLAAYETYLCSWIEIARRSRRTPSSKLSTRKKSFDADGDLSDASRYVD